MNLSKQTDWGHHVRESVRAKDTDPEAEAFVVHRALGLISASVGLCHILAQILFDFDTHVLTLLCFLKMWFN